MKIKVLGLLLLVGICEAHNPVKADLQKTIYINDVGHSGGFHGGRGGAPVTCKSLDGMGSSLKCTANQGYIFWVGQCNSSTKYIRTGNLGRGQGSFCLRAIRPGEL